MKLEKWLLGLLLFGGAASAWGYQEQSGPVKAQLKIEAGLQSAYNFDLRAGGFKNYIRELGFWIELFNAENGVTQTEADPTSETPQVQIHVKNLKFALKTFSQKEVTNNGVELQNSYSSPTGSFSLIDTKGDSIDVSLTWKGFWLGLVASSDGTVSWGGSSNVFTPRALGFDYAGSDANTSMTGTGIAKLGGRSAKLLAAQGLFVPDSTQWDNNPAQFGPNPTYYTLDSSGGVGSTVLTAGGLDVNPYDSTQTAGILRFGYGAKSWQVSVGVGAQGNGLSLFSAPADVNQENAFSGQINLSGMAGSSLAVDLSALGGVNYETLGNPYGAGGKLGYSFNLFDDLYLVPVVGADYVYKKSLGVSQDFYQVSGGLKFLVGEGLDSKNDFSSQDTYRGLSVVALTDQDQLVNLQAALYEPASRRSFFRNLGLQAFAEAKNLTQWKGLDSGRTLWGVGAKATYLLPGPSLEFYGYGHYKLNAAANAGQTVVRAGVEYSGIKSLVVDAYYLMGRLDTTQNNLGNMVCDLRFSY